jgi:glycine/D-amino acid oxidase-like deaminating enzyme
MKTDASRFEVIVVGIGGMGSAAAWHLARRGHRVLGLDRFVPPHEMGSSHGLSRIIRLTYFEHPSYVPLLRRAYELWRELERFAGEQLLYITGALEIGAPGGAVVEGSLKSAEIHGLPFELLTSAQAIAPPTHVGCPRRRRPAAGITLHPPGRSSADRCARRGTPCHPPRAVCGARGNRRRPSHRAGCARFPLGQPA